MRTTRPGCISRTEVTEADSLSATTHKDSRIPIPWTDDPLSSSARPSARGRRPRQRSRNRVETTVGGDVHSVDRRMTVTAPAYARPRKLGTPSDAMAGVR